MEIQGVLDVLLGVSLIVGVWLMFAAQVPPNVFFAIGTTAAGLLLILRAAS